MTDPFRGAALRTLLIAGAFLVLLATVVVASSYLDFGMPITHGHAVKAEVLNVGTHPVAGVGGGDLPVLTVRLPNGAVRVVQATWPDVVGCKTGRAISLLEQGNALQVGQPGCVSA